MRSRVVHRGVVCLTVCLVLAVGVIPGVSNAGEIATHGKTTLPVAFTKNMGQWPDSILYQTRVEGTVIWFSAAGVTYEVTRRVSGSAEANGSPGYPEAIRTSRGLNNAETLRICASLKGRNPQARVQAEGLMGYECNYFLGNDPVKWHTNVPNYGAITYQSVYPGVDLRFSQGVDGSLTYEYDIRPGTDLAGASVDYEGSAEVFVDGTGRVVAKSDWCEIAGILAVPSTESQLASGFSVIQAVGGGAEVSHAPLDAKLSELLYSTYLSRPGMETEAWGIAVDASGYAYVTERVGHHLVKFNTAGDDLVYSADINIFLVDVEVDGNGNAYVSGAGDAIVTKLNAAGDSVIFITYVGGSDYDDAWSIAVDSSGSVYLTGTTESTDFPTTNAFDTSYNGGFDDVYVAKLNAEGDSLIYSTYLGGTGRDEANSIAIGASGNAYVTGFTSSVDFPVENYIDYTLGGSKDAFVTKLNTTGTALVYSTYLGGSNEDVGNGIAVNSAGQAVLTGFAGSSDFPTVNAIDSTYSGGDAFVTMLVADGDDLVFSTFLGGSNPDGGTGIVLDKADRILLTGYTSSFDFPTVDPVFADTSGEDDVFVTKLLSDGSALIYSTYLGGSQDDFGNAIAVDNVGNAYVAGYSYSTDFPLVNPYDSCYIEHTAFVTKLRSNLTCCIGSRGNVDGSLDDAVTLSDLAALNQYLFVTLEPLPCWEEANMDASSPEGPGSVTLGDLSVLIDHLYITLTPMRSCP